MTVLPLTPDELLTTTRSVRKRLDLTRPVPIELVSECLQIATQSPTGSNLQGWHWLVITDPEIKVGIGDLYRRSTEKYLAAKERASDLEVLADHITAGTVTPSIDRTYQLNRMPEAMRHLEAGRHEILRHEAHNRPR